MEFGLFKVFSLRNLEKYTYKLRFFITMQNQGENNEGISEELYNKIMRENKEYFDALEEYDRTGKIPLKIQKGIEKALREKGNEKFR